MLNSLNLKKKTTWLIYWENLPLANKLHSGSSQNDWTTVTTASNFKQHIFLLSCNKMEHHQRQSHCLHGLQPWGMAQAGGDTVSHLPPSPWVQFQTAAKGSKLIVTPFSQCPRDNLCSKKQKEIKDGGADRALVGTHAQFLSNKPRTENIDSSRSTRFLREKKKSESASAASLFKGALPRGTTPLSWSISESRDHGDQF